MESHLKNSSGRIESEPAETKRLLSLLPAQTRDRITAFFQHERRSDLLPFLAAGHCLRELQHEIALELSADDAALWRVRSHGDTPEFLVDVVPIELSADQLTEFRVSSSLVETLQTIPVNQRLHMTVTDYRHILGEDSRQQILERTHDWLTTTSPSVGAILEFEGITLTMMPWDKTRDHLAVIGPAFAYWIRKLQIDAALQERVQQSHEIAANYPYVIAAVAPERVGLSRRCYAELLSTSPDEPEPIRRVAATEKTRLPLFTAHSEISAAAWVWKSSRRIWEMKSIHNPAAHRPLPDTALASSA